MKKMPERTLSGCYFALPRDADIVSSACECPIAGLKKENIVV
jgi:hypothetical protein